MRRLVLSAALLLLASACQRPAGHPPRSIGIERHPGVRDLYAFAETYRAKHGQPALGVGIVHRGRIVGLGMAGERAAGSGSWASVDDAFDVASCSKSVTATVAALLVEDGAIAWDTTVVAAFPELRDRIHPGYAHATLERLLRHTAGLGHDLNRNARWSGWHREHAAATPAAQRLAFVAAALARPPIHAPGTATAYTSDGYVIAGSMLERAAGIGWEDLVEARLTAPLQLHSMRYGPIVGGTATQGVVGHESGWFGRPVAIASDPAEYGSRPFGAPAGFLYASIPDLLRYVDLHIQGDNGRGRLLSQASFRTIHDAAGGPYALGWQSDVRRDERGAIVERSLYHGGYSGRFRANLWFVPETQWGTAIVMNHGRGDEAITSDVFHALLREFGLAARGGPWRRRSAPGLRPAAAGDPLQRRAAPRPRRNRREGGHVREQVSVHEAERRRVGGPVRETADRDPLRIDRDRREHLRQGLVDEGGVGARRAARGAVQERRTRPAR